MRRTWLAWLAGVMLLCWFLPYSTSQAKKKAPPETVVLKAKKGDVTFPHKKHVDEYKVKCRTCHHKMDTDKDKMSCRSCHGAKKQGDVPKAMTAFHKRCKGCHKKHKPKAPTKCKGCHKK